MYAVGDLDDAVSVVDIWLHEHPGPAIWERDEDASSPYNDSYRPSWERDRDPLRRNPFLD